MKFVLLHFYIITFIFTVAILAQAIISMAKRYQRCQNKIHKKKHKKKIVDLQQKNRLLRQKVISVPLQLQDEYEDIAYRLYTTIELQELEIILLQPHDSDTLEQLETNRKLAEQELENRLLRQQHDSNTLEQLEKDRKLAEREKQYRNYKMIY